MKTALSYLVVKLDSTAQRWQATVSCTISTTGGERFNGSGTYMENREGTIRVLGALVSEDEVCVNGLTWSQNLYL